MTRASKATTAPNTSAPYRCPACDSRWFVPVYTAALVTRPDGAPLILHGDRHEAVQCATCRVIASVHEGPRGRRVMLRPITEPAP